MSHTATAKLSVLRFEETPLWGAFVVHSAKSDDERGFFARTFCKQQFEQQGLVSQFVQTSMSFNRRRGTLRGMHYQLPPCEETKLVQCIRGAVYDVLLDLRPQSPTFRQWMSMELTERDASLLYVPAGLAHGFQTLTDDVALLYSISAYYDARLGQGVRWDDPAFGIRWPSPPACISARDATFTTWGSLTPSESAARLTQSTVRHLAS